MVSHGRGGIGEYDGFFHCMPGFRLTLTTTRTEDDRNPVQEKGGRERERTRAREKW
jgi:hypothetical protein